MSVRPSNAFLRALGDESFAQLEATLQPVNLALGVYLQRDEERVDWVYFPETCLISVISAHSNGDSVETSMSGNEGAAGFLEACGSQMSSVDCVVQVDGAAVRAPASLCRTLASSNADIGAVGWRLAELQIAESRQSGLCQAMHAVERRFARWMLESMDRSGGRNPLPMTQEFLAAMLGVQRTTVSALASNLQREGVITYKRGQILIGDKARLEDMACECRSITERQRDRLGFRSIQVTAPTP
jgi:CRP-like cAMP-binding protein